MATYDVFNHNVPAESDFGYSQAIKSGDLIHVSGQLSLDEAGEFRYAGDFAAQLEQTYVNLDKVLDHYGVTRNQVISQTLYVVNEAARLSLSITAAHSAAAGHSWPISSLPPVLARPG